MNELTMIETQLQKIENNQNIHLVNATDNTMTMTSSNTALIFSFVLLLWDMIHVNAVNQDSNKPLHLAILGHV
jgi:hypothetical protein